MNKLSDFVLTMLEAAAEVDKWPQWKKEALGLTHLTKGRCDDD